MGTAGKIHFDGFTLDLERRALYRGEQRIHLTPKPLATLIYLVENRGDTVEKQKLLDAVWKDTFVTEDTLVHAIREIRRALGDDKANPRFVQTVPREGYRFVCEICTADEIELSAPKDQGLLPASPPLVEPRRKTARRLWLAAPVLALALALIWFFWPHEGRTSHEVRPNGIFKQITTGEFPSGKPVFSPDGKFILYVSSSESTRGFGDLFVRQFPEGNAQRITNRINPGGDLPVFTSDGSHAVFSMPKVDQDGARHHDLWIVPSFGGSPKRLVEDASGAGFSPDGKWVAYTKHLSSGNALWLSPVAALQEHIEVKAGGYAPRWSHNGELLAYSTSDPNGGDGDLWICRISESTNGQPAVSDDRQITTDNRQIYGLTWTIDDRSIIFGSKRTGSAQLHEVSIADRIITSFLLGVGEYEAPSAAPDGRTVIFHNKRLLNDLKITSLSAGCESKAVTYGEFRLWPRFSPSGERLVTVLRQVDNTERLYLTDLKTKESSQLSEREARHPCWLDEENIAFLSSDASSKDTEVLVVNTATRETRSLTLFSGDANWLAIHPDRKRIAVALRSPDGKERILLRDLSNGVDQTIQEGAEYEYLRWSPDGSALCWDKPGVSRNAPNLSGGIWLQAGQTQPRLIANDGYCPVWSQNGTAVYFTTRSGEQALWRYDLSQKRIHKVCDWGTVYSFDILGTRVAFSELRNDTQIYSVSIE